MSKQFACIISTSVPEGKQSQILGSNKPFIPIIGNNPNKFEPVEKRYVNANVNSNHDFRELKRQLRHDSILDRLFFNPY